MVLGVVSRSRGWLRWLGELGGLRQEGSGGLRQEGSRGLRQEGSGGVRQEGSGSCIARRKRAKQRRRGWRHWCGGRAGTQSS